MLTKESICVGRFQRPAYSTGLLIPFSFLCGIAAGVNIWRGGTKTKRTKEVQERLRQALAGNSQDDPRDCTINALSNDHNQGAVSGSVDGQHASGSRGRSSGTIDGNEVDEEKVAIPTT